MDRDDLYCSAANSPRCWVYRDAYDKLTINKWRPWKTLWIFEVIAFG